MFHNYKQFLSRISRRHLSTKVSAPYRRRRCLFNVPGSDERKLFKCTSLQADSIVLDLEDGVPFDKKQDARRLVTEALRTFDFGQSERCVRINSMDSGVAHHDLMAILPCEQLQTIVLPKTESAADIVQLQEWITKYRWGKSPVQIIACIESPLAVLNLREIATSSVHIAALLFASEDFCAASGVKRSPSLQEMLVARQSLVLAAKANNLQAIDLVCIDYKNQEQLKLECENGRQFGFTGKQAIHPGQIETIQSLFQPSPAEIEDAQAILRLYKEHSANEGKGAFQYKNKVVDLPVVKEAQKTLLNAGIPIDE